VKKILSMNDLTSRLGVARSDLLALAGEVERHYKTWSKVNKKTGKVRVLHAPSKQLKDVQKRITRNILLKIDISPDVHGGVKGCSPRTNATPHLRRQWVANLDVRDFFPQVKHGVVLRLFRIELSFGRDVARVLTRLTTRDGGLPQGAPTSLALANLILWKPLDLPIAEKAAALDLQYTRWVDDISASGDDPRPLINAVALRLSQRGLRMYRERAKYQTKPKLKITPRWQRQEVTGLVVNGRTPSISRHRRDKVKAAIHQMSGLKGFELLKAYESVQGRINHISQFNPGAADRLRLAFQKAGGRAGVDSRASR
jgi:RNA-directed DNA polymerase